MPEDPSFFIFIERLKKGTEEVIDANFSPAFLGIGKEALAKEGLAFEKPVAVKGKAYLAGDMLIIELDWNVEATIPCSICNQPVYVKLAFSHVIFDVPLEEIKGGKYSFSEDLRESILLETPQFAECEGGCRERKDIEKYFAVPSQEAEDRYHPFENL